MSVIIFGSINMDLVVRAPHFPQPGESEIGSTFFTAPGGKGSNQAVASARLGTPTMIFGRVGGDVFSSVLIQSLQENGVDTRGVFSDPGQPSGTALITLNDEGENTIVYIPGANNTMDDSDLNRLKPALEKADWLLLQLEIPMEVNLNAARAARQQGVPILMVAHAFDGLPDIPIHLVVMNRGRITGDLSCQAGEVEEIIRKECEVKERCSSG